MEKKRNFDKLIKALQIASIIFMALSLIIGLILMNKYNISIKNTAVLEQWLSGSVPTVALFLIAFAVIKSFAMVITPSVVFAVSGLVFEKLWVAIAVNIIATCVSMIIPYYLGRFTGKGMYDSLKAKYSSVRKFDDFSSNNEFLNVFLVKSTNVIPSDLSSLLLGAIGTGFKSFFVASNLGVLPISILWAYAGHKGDLSNPKTIVYIIPVFIFSAIACVVLKIITNKRNKKRKINAE